MKRGILIALVFLFAASYILVQRPNVAKAVYDKWRQEAPADELSRTGFALAAVTRRTGKEVAKLDLWGLSRAQEVVVEVQPLHVETLPNGELRQEQAGVMTKSNIGSQDNRSVAGETAGLKLTLPVRPNANALKIQWSEYTGDKLIHFNDFTVRLQSEPTEALLKVNGGQ
jgi:hypothetical protein